MHGPELLELAEDWDLSLAAENKSPATRTTYGTAVRQLAEYLAGHGHPTTVDAITSNHVAAYIAHLLDNRSASTAKTRFGGLQVFFRWAEAEGEIELSPMVRMRPPKVAAQPTPVLSEDALRAVLAAVGGKTYDDRRDRALILVMLQGGTRVAELCGMRLDDLDPRAASAGITVLGKGGSRRYVPLRPNAALAVRRYIRARARHPHAASDALWLGKVGPLTPAGVRQILERIGDRAGVPGLHPHQLRHTWAHLNRANGMSEGELMHLGGWRDRRMLDRYGASVAAERAAQAARRMTWGDDL